MADVFAPPGPPSMPRCPECGGPHGTKSWMPRHLPDCSIGNESRRRSDVSRTVRQAIDQAISNASIDQAISNAYTDVALMDALHGVIASEGVHLERLLVSNAAALSQAAHSVLVEVLVYHWRTNSSGCGCGWGGTAESLGRSWPEHVVEVFEQAVALRLSEADGG